MKQVTAVLEEREDRQVLDAADALARLLGVGTTQLLVPLEDTPARASQVLEALDGPEVAGVVLSARASDTVCWQVLPSITGPVLVIPERCERTAHDFERVLLPLDGAQATADSVAAFVHLAQAAGAQVIAMHVFEPHTVPAFWDQPAHSVKEWTQEFLARNLTGAIPLDLRSGRPAEEVLAAAARTEVDLIVLGWAQELGTDRAQVVRLALEEGAIPVLLISTRGDAIHRPAPQDVIRSRRPSNRFV